jgi:hypothetical protein
VSDAPIYVASLGRPEAPLFRVLEDEGIPYTIAVEPQEVARYWARDANILTLPESGRGLPYARQFILGEARAAGHEWIWILDDDVSGFVTVHNSRCVPSSASWVLTEAERAARALPDCAQAGLEYRQYAWSATKDFTEYTFCDCAVLFNVERTRHVDYCTDIKLKGDREYTLRLILAGWLVVRFHKLAFSSPTNGTNVGGLADIYAHGHELRAVEEVVRMHPQICKFIEKPNGRFDVRFNWKAARKLATTLPKRST